MMSAVMVESKVTFSPKNDDPAYRNPHDMDKMKRFLFSAFLANISFLLNVRKTYTSKIALESDMSAGVLR